MAVTILVVEDHPVFRIGLEAALRSRGVSQVLTSDGSLAHLRDIHTSIASDAAWVALVDIRLGSGVDGIDVCRYLRDLTRPPIVIMLTTFDEPAVRQAARDAGAFAFLSKESDVESIISVVQAGLRGEPARIPDQNLPSLTAREQDVLLALRDGHDTKGIARLLGIGPATVKDHLESIYTKLGVSDRMNAVRVAADMGIMSLMR